LASLSFPAIPSTTSASSRRLSGPTITTSRDVAGMRVQYCLIANLLGTQKIKSLFQDRIMRPSRNFLTETALHSQLA
jgi:hypothetical protein